MTGNSMPVVTIREFHFCFTVSFFYSDFLSYWDYFIPFSSEYEVSQGGQIKTKFVRKRCKVKTIGADHKIPPSVHHLYQVILEMWIALIGIDTSICILFKNQGQSPSENTAQTADPLGPLPPGWGKSRF